MEKPTFRLFKGDKEIRFEVIADHHWKVIRANPRTGFQFGDEVSPIERISWQKAKRRVNSKRSALGLNRFVLLRGEGWERSDREVAKLLHERPWDPDVPPVA